MTKDVNYVKDNGTLGVKTVNDDGTDIVEAVEPVAEPFGGKGDHDRNGKVGGAKPVEPEPEADKPAKKRR